MSMLKPSYSDTLVIAYTIHGRLCRRELVFFSLKVNLSLTIANHTLLIFATYVVFGKWDMIPSQSRKVNYVECIVQ